MFHTLHDFTLYVKGSGYLTAAVVLCLIVPFWLYLIGGEKRLKNRTVRK